MSNDNLIASLTAAVESAPDDTALRLHLAELLLAAGRPGDALRHLAVVLQQEPASARALELISDASGESEGPNAVGFDWEHAERQLDSAVPPMFVEGDPAIQVGAWDVERESITLAEVGGLAHVKERLELAFLAPLRNPELRALYGKSLRGGLLLYGPPGCGKTYIARALAGELGAGFLSVTISDVLDVWIGSSERNLSDLFDTARRNAPCVVFIDELDALGHRRSQLGNNAMRTAVNQLLMELDGVEDENEGLFVLAATNHPWDIDPALRRPGRFDRMVLVLPPDEPARAAIFDSNLRERPVAGIDLGKLARMTDRFSGADIAYVCESAAERAMLDAVRSGTVRMIEMHDLEAAIRDIKPSTAPWFETARTVVTFANRGGDYDDLHAYMKEKRL